MKILSLRVDKPIPQFQSNDRFVDGENGTKLGVMPWGSFIVQRNGKAVMVPATAGIADVELSDDQEEAKRGPGRPKKEPTPAA